jgi:hypothetical protein
VPLSPDELARLDTAYRAQQATTQAAVGLAVLRLWGGLDAVEIAERNARAVENFINQSTAIILGGFRRTREQAVPFYDAVRLAQVGSTISQPRIPEPSEEQIKTSLYVTGIVGARHRLDKVAAAPPEARARGPITEEDVDLGEPLIARQRELLAAGRQAEIREALSKAGNSAVGAAVRHAGNGGREQIRETVKVDVRATGYARITAAAPCYFCAMLASRGAIYKEDSFAASDARFEGPGNAKVHDSCQCGMRPVYTKNESEWPEFNQAMHSLWESGDMEGDMDTLLAWRRLYEGRQDGTIQKRKPRY